MSITKAVIPCGGMGTRFLPITKAVAKEILPVIDTPVLGHIVNEAINSGITDILIVLGKGKEAIKNYFTPNDELEKKLRDGGKDEFADILVNISKGARITFEVQQEPLGSGDAVLYAEKFADGESFVLAWGDDLMYADAPVMSQLMGAYDKYQSTILGVQTVLTDDIVKYGVADIGGVAENAADRTYKCNGIVEKPTIDKIPSRLCALGRYVLTSEIFDVIRKTPTGVGGELQLTDSLNIMALGGDVYVHDFVGKRYDMGDKFGALCASIDYGVRDKVFGQKLKDFLKEYVKTL